MPYNFIADRFHTTNFVADFLSEVQFWTENSRSAFSAPFGCLGATYDVHLRFIGKYIVDFLLVLIELLLN